MEATAGSLRRPRLKTYRWDYRAEDPERARALQSSLQLGSVVSRVLANRGLDVDKVALGQYIRPALNGLLDPFLMRDMTRAIERTRQAVERREKIVIYGDYDTDGVTSTVIMLKAFEFIGYPVDYYIPHRMSEGYGLNHAAIEQLGASGARLIITVDNGVSALDQVKRASELGIDVIVTDHHQVTTELPDCLAVVNPNRHDCQYPNKYLTGVGVAFKFVHALLKSRGVAASIATPFLRSLLDIVAIGTVADLAPLSGENRIIVKYGLQQLAATENVGLGEMKRALGMASDHVSAYKIGFHIAPRLNAAGRTDSANICVELLMTNDVARAAEIAVRLEQLNRERRSVESHTFEEGLRYIETSIDLDNERVLVVRGEGWHVGVIGIVASRILELYDRPVVVISEHENHAKGSARSVAGFNMYAALEECSSHLLAFGGHPFAAGLQLLPNNIEGFRVAINECARRTLREEAMLPALVIDTQVQAHEIRQSLIDDLAILEPFGASNPSPIFSLTGLKLAEAPRVVGTNHLKLQLCHAGRNLSAIGFNLGGFAEQLSANRDALIDVAFLPTVNTYLSHTRIELELRDLKINRTQ